MRGVGAAFLLVLTAIGAAGCGEDDRPASFRYIQTAILGPGCTTSSCHTENNHQKDVELWSRDASYETLLGEPCTPDAPVGVGDRVIPGDPENSSLLGVLRGEYSDTRMMPPDRPLPRPDIELIERWIAEGAACN